MRLYDISMDIYTDMPVYKDKDEKRPVLTTISVFQRSSAYESRILMDLHTGTHIDAPLHMIQNGGTIDGVELQKLFTRCKVFDMTGVADKIMKSHLQDRDIHAGDFILLKTANSFQNKFLPDFVFLHESGAEYLAEQKIHGVGIDALGIERGQPDHSTHKILLGADIIILEGLRLADIQEGGYILCALPLKIKGAEASPVRAVLIDGLDEL